jgi:hypothetical protein
MSPLFLLFLPYFFDFFDFVVLVLKQSFRPIKVLVGRPRYSVPRFSTT